ncbi:MAG TPA: quinone oxidoreductase [Bacteroidota bacterium]|nr:quinone oxidoreductase [Bacteroidota bacterium]
MKAICIHGLGGPEVLHYEDVAVPQPGPGEARVKMEAVGVNFIDVYFRKGLYNGSLPMVLGQEGAGVVDAVGTGVREVRVGDRVAFAPWKDSYAEFVSIPASRLVPVPDNVNTQQAAAAILQGLTAHYLSHSTYPIQKGDTVLVHAAAGGTGALLVQIAKMKGAHVIGTVSNDIKEREARSLGADDVIVYTQVDFAEEVKRITSGKGVKVVYDSVGIDTFEKSLSSLKPRGYMVLFGQSSGRVQPFDPQVLNAKGSLFLTRPTLAHYVATREELLHRSKDLFDWIGEGKLKIRIGRKFPLAQAAEAHNYLEGRKALGKLLLIP